ncbi:HTH-type transcriptional regulator MntR [subsurface metagenome]
MTKLGKTNYNWQKLHSKGKKLMVVAKSNKLSASLEDYLEAIFNLAGESNVAHSKDIAKLLGVAKPSVTGALKLLAKKGLVNYRPYGYVTLTDSGVAQAARVAGKHNIIKSFFVNILGVDAKVAQEAACKAEHALGPAIVSRLLDFTDFITQTNGSGPDLADKFKRFRKARRQGGRKQISKQPRK